MGSGCSSPKGSEFGGGGNLGSPTSGQHGDGVHQKPSFGNPASVASIDTGARARDGKEDARSPKMGKAMMLFADATPKNLNVVLDDPGFYLRFFKYETEKVPCGEVAERAFEVRRAPRDQSACPSFMLTSVLGKGISLRAFCCLQRERLVCSPGGIQFSASVHFFQVRRAKKRTEESH